MSYTITHLRGRNVANRNSERLTSADGRRWALGRTVKRSLANHRWDTVRVWSLRERLDDGSWRETARYATAEEAEAWAALDTQGVMP